MLQVLLPVVWDSIQRRLDRLDAWAVLGEQLLCVPLRDLPRHSRARNWDENDGRDLLHFFHVCLLRGFLFSLFFVADLFFIDNWWWWWTLLFVMLICTTNSNNVTMSVCTSSRAHCIPTESHNCRYWVVATFTTVGYGDISANADSTPELLCSVIAMAIGSIIFARLVTTVLAMITVMLFSELQVCRQTPLWLISVCMRLPRTMHIPIT